MFELKCLMCMKERILYCSYALCDFEPVGRIEVRSDS